MSFFYGKLSSLSCGGTCCIIIIIIIIIIKGNSRWVQKLQTGEMQNFGSDTFSGRSSSTNCCALYSYMCLLYYIT